MIETLLGLFVAGLLGALLVGMTLTVFAVFAPIKRAVDRARRPWSGLPGTVRAEPPAGPAVHLRGRVGRWRIEGGTEDQRAILEASPDGPPSEPPAPWVADAGVLRWEGPAEPGEVARALHRLNAGAEVR